VRYRDRNTLLTTALEDQMGSKEPKNLPPKADPKGGTVKSPRDAASGLATGKRTHNP
jgi:hypothetical protein